MGACSNRSSRGHIVDLNTYSTCLLKGVEDMFISSLAHHLKNDFFDIQIAKVSVSTVDTEIEILSTYTEVGGLHGSMNIVPVHLHPISRIPLNHWSSHYPDLLNIEFCDIIAYSWGG